MRRLILMFVMLLALCGVALAQCLPPDSNYVVYVAPWGLDNGTNHAGVGVSSVNPYLTITAAVADCGDGNTIVIQPGTYPESVTIAKRLYLKGVNRSAVIYAATGNALNMSYGSDGSEMHGLSFFAPSGNAIYADARKNLIIEDCNVVGGTTTIHLASAEDVDLRNCIIDSNQLGLAARSSTKIRISRCSFRGLTSITAGTTFCNINNQLCSGLVIDNCVFDVNLPYGSSWPTTRIANIMWGASAGKQMFTVSNCTFRLNLASDYSGNANCIQLATADSQASFLNCVFESNAVSVSSVTDVNAVVGKAVLTGCSYNKVTGNVYVSDPNYGLQLAAQASLTPTKIELSQADANTMRSLSAHDANVAGSFVTTNAAITAVGTTGVSVLSKTGLPD